MPTPKAKPAVTPDFIPADGPDFIPADSGSAPQQTMAAPDDDRNGLQKFGDAVLPSAVMHPVDTFNEVKQHPLKSALNFDTAELRGVGSMLKNTFDEGGEMGKSLVGTNAPMAAIQARSGHPMAAAKTLWKGSDPAAAATHALFGVPIVGPAIRAGANNPNVGGTGSFAGDVGSEWSDPENVGNMMSAAGQTGLLGLGMADAAVSPTEIGEATGAVTGRKLLGQIPTKGRGAAMLNYVEQKAANTPVQMTATQPALDEFGQSVRTGGRNAPVMTKLSKRIGQISSEPPSPSIHEATGLPLNTDGTVNLHYGEDGMGQYLSDKPDIFSPTKPVRVNPDHFQRGNFYPDSSSQIFDIKPELTKGSTAQAGHGNPLFRNPENSLLFPEARDFYTNVSRVSAKPGFLRRAIESPQMPALRYNAGNVREAMNADLTNAADTIGQGENYTGGMSQFRNAARFNKMAKIGLGLAAEETARRTGLLGKLGLGLASTAP